MRIYAVGDIHGQLAMLKDAHEKIARDRAEIGDYDAPVVHLGDLTDRGPDSRGVIDYLMNGIARGEPWVVIKGNHDRMFSLFLQQPSQRDAGLRPGMEWLNPRLGGLTTLASYGIETEGRNEAELHADAIAVVPEEHRRFLELLPLKFAIKDVLFVHAGIRPGVTICDQVEDDLVWMREPFLSDTTDHGPLIVHGHTALDKAEHRGNRVNLDSSAGYGLPLTSAVFEGRDCWILEGEGRVALKPVTVIPSE